MLQIFLLVLGLILLIVFSNVFVDSSTSLANSFKIPKMVVALTIASFCTCAPELAVSFSSLENYDVSIANVIGSCIANILLIIGIGSLIKPIKIETATVKKEIPLLILSSLSFCLLFLDGKLSRYDSLVLILLFLLFCLYLYKMIKRFKKVEDSDTKINKLKSFILTIFSLFVIILGSDLVVDSTLYLARTYNIAPKLISMIVIVIGTSLPELMITITSAKKGEFDMTVGNIIGSNIFNICIVLGLPILMFGTVISNSFNYVDLFMLVLSPLLFYIFCKSKMTVSRLEGSIMIFVFILYYSSLIFF